MKIEMYLLKLNLFVILKCYIFDILGFWVVFVFYIYDEFFLSLVNSYII